MYAGKINSDLHIWLSYVSYPATTAAYIEKELRRICRVTTVGPKLPDFLVDAWALQNLKEEIRPHNIDTEVSLDISEIYNSTPPAERPDIFIWIDSVSGFLPANITKLPCIRVGYLIDTHLNLELHRDIASQFDILFLVHRQFVEDIRTVNPRSYWLPVACDPEIHGATAAHKLYDIGFAGSLSAGSRRSILLETLSCNFDLRIERCFLREMGALFAASRIVFNSAVKNDLNMRFFEAMSAGAMLLSDYTVGTGQEEMFVNGEDYVCYADENLVAAARYCLENNGERAKIAARGQQLVHSAHTYMHRVLDMLDVICGRKEDTFSAEELRARSLRTGNSCDALNTSRDYHEGTSLCSEEYGMLERLAGIDAHICREEALALFRLAMGLEEGANILEIGSYKGASTSALAHAALLKKHIVYCIDPWADYEKQPDFINNPQFDPFSGEKVILEFKRNTAFAGRSIRPLHGYSSDFAELIPTSFFKMIFIDGAHDYSSVCADILLALSKLKPGGVLCGHDYHSRGDGVVSAVNELLFTAPTIMRKGLMPDTSIWYAFIEEPLYELKVMELVLKMKSGEVTPDIERLINEFGPRNELLKLREVIPKQ